MVVVEYARGDTTVAGVRVGFRTKDADVLIGSGGRGGRRGGCRGGLFVGTTTEEWETEGRDRRHSCLPGRQDELVAGSLRRTRNGRRRERRGAGRRCRGRTRSRGVQCWFGGEEMAAASRTCDSGITEPGGRLPTTIPVRLEHTPSARRLPGENGELRYGEGLFMGYRGYEHRAISSPFAFGHGLSYTTFEIG